jgi:hypothetical protein
MTNSNDIQKALDSQKLALLSKKNVVAVGIGYKTAGGEKTSDLSIVCSVEKKEDISSLSAEDLVPSQVDSIPTDVVETGKFKAQPTTKHWPVQGGSSVGHPQVTAGTLGCLVTRGSDLHILSNNHVIAASNQANYGDAIIHPGRVDSGRAPYDVFATVADYIPIKFVDAIPKYSTIGIADRAARYNSTYGTYTSIAGYVKTTMPTYDPWKHFILNPSAPNYIDAAIARVYERDVENVIRDIPQINGLNHAEVGMEVKKSGRSTNLTTGVVSQISVTISVEFDDQEAIFHNQVITENSMSQGGDSGSVVLDEDNRVVGLLFAGSENATAFNRSDYVFDFLDIELA